MILWFVNPINDIVIRLVDCTELVCEVVVTIKSDEDKVWEEKEIEEEMQKEGETRWDR